MATKKLTITPAIIAQGLRRARDLMNNGGDHWTQGVEKEEHPEKPGEFLFCSIGSIKEVLGGNGPLYEATVIQLAKCMSPDGMDDAKADLDHDRAAGWIITDQEYQDSLVARAEEVIIGANDADDTKWEDVRSWFTQAAKRIARRKKV